LKLAGRIEKFLGAAGINVLEKVFGIILLAIAVKLFSNNIQYLFH
jgi:multiple antibiotic resistance protein